MTKNFFSSFGNKALRAAQAGFTMIELLVVIAVIGVLSVAVLSSINPIEQINKGRDTRARSDAATLINAVDRYFSIAEQYPWNTTSDTYDASGHEEYEDEFILDEIGSDSTDGSVDWDFLDILVENQEVKSGFVNRIRTDSRVNYYMQKSAGTNTTMYVCFAPSSNAFKQEAATRCAAGMDTDAPGIACPDGIETDAEDALVCLP